VDAYHKFVEAAEKLIPKPELDLLLFDFESRTFHQPPRCELNIGAVFTNQRG